MSSPDRYNTNNARARRSPSGDPHSSLFQGQGGRTVLPPISSAFPTSHFPVPPQVSPYAQHTQQYSQPRSSPGSRDYQVAYPPQWNFNSYQASHQIYYDDQVDPRYTSASNSNYPARMTPPLHGDTHSSRRAPQFSVANVGSDRWQSAASYTPTSGQMPTPSSMRSHAAAYPVAYPSYNAPHSSYSYPPIPDPRVIPQQESYVDQIHIAQAAAVDRSGMTRAERATPPYARSSTATAPYSQPPASPTEETPQIKKKRKRADAAQLEVLNEVYNRTAFPSTEERAELAKKLDMTPRSVQIWFQNKRQSMRQTTRQPNAVTSGSHQAFTVSPSNPEFDDMPHASVGGYDCASTSSSSGTDVTYTQRLDAPRPSSTRSSHSPDNVQSRNWNARY